MRACGSWRGRCLASHSITNHFGGGRFRGEPQRYLGYLARCCARLRICFDRTAFYQTQRPPIPCPKCRELGLPIALPQRRLSIRRRSGVRARDLRCADCEARATCNFDSNMRSRFAAKVASSIARRAAFGSSAVVCNHHFQSHGCEAHGLCGCRGLKPLSAAGSCSAAQVRARH
jgi:hypothetical protein